MVVVVLDLLVSGVAAEVVADLLEVEQRRQQLWQQQQQQKKKKKKKKK